MSQHILRSMVLTTALIIAPWGATNAEEKVLSVGSFHNFRFTEEHQSGYGVNLWRHGDTLLGILEVADGLAGDTPSGVLEDTQHDPETGALSFGARLTTGRHFCGRHQDVPSRDLYQFTGTLNEGVLTGDLAYLDVLHPGLPFRTERVELKKSENNPRPFASRAEWEEFWTEVLSWRGPEW